MKQPRANFDGRMLILVVILVLGTGASQAVYRSSIEAMHHSLLASIETAEIVHAAENFHSSVHSMLLMTGTIRLPPNDREDTYAKQKDQARTALKALSIPKQNHPADSVETAMGNLDTTYAEFESLMDSLRAQTIPISKDQVARAEALYDALFQIYLQVLHTYHDGRLDDLRVRAHDLNDQTDLLFWIQLGFLVVSVVLAIVFTFLALFRPFQTASQQALFDGLTGLGNRRYWDKKLVPQIEDRIKQGLPFSLCLMDVDRFKQFNDTHGHPAGDKLLKGLSKVIRQEIRTTDEVVRFGGEEFLFVLWGTTPDQAVAILEKVRSSIEDLRIDIASGSQVGTTASFGIACSPSLALSAAGLVEIADQNLYQAKDQGRNRIVS